MPGFAISIYRQPRATIKSGGFDQQLTARDFNKTYGQELVSWDSWDLEWIDDLVTAGRARQLKVDGYPMLYVAERDLVSEVLVEYQLKRNASDRNLYLQAREPRNGLWMQSLDRSSSPTGFTRRVLWGADSAPSIRGLNCESNLNWIDSLVEQGKATLLEDGEKKLYSGGRETLTKGLLSNRLADTRNDEALVVTAWDLS